MQYNLNVLVIIVIRVNCDLANNQRVCCLSHSIPLPVQACMVPCSLVFYLLFIMFILLLCNVYCWYRCIFAIRLIMGYCKASRLVTELLSILDHHGHLLGPVHVLSLGHT